MAESSPIIDVWTQFLTGTPPGVNPEGENVFRNYGMLEVFHHGTDAAQMVEAMDRSGVRIALMAGDNAAVAQAQNRFPGRIYGEYHADPRHIMKAVRELDHYVRSCGFVALRIEPFMWRKAPTDRSYYPLYAKAAELDVTFQTQVGHTGPLFPSETGRPIYIDEVALDFPELRIVCGHIGWPWTEEMIAVAWKHRNVWIDTSAHVPKHYPAAFVHFLKTFGRDKVCFATDYPLLQWERVLKEVEALELPAEVTRRFLHDNAVKAFNLTHLSP
ncbi:MAG: amidohydrolase [Deltaproteobacteria bacterium]|nr:MAG: amidohydrolase [Deltaproteobacteria bacterium]TMB14482.1 MAG: amidohydrolase [Deltaproteobacteria bacterium]